MGARAARWSCARCEVSVGRIDGKTSCLPDTWTRCDGLTYCLSCSRARAADAALDSATESASREDRVRLRRSALIAFEIGRAPAAPDRAIANACRTSSRTVAAVRDELTADPATDGRAERRVA
jgi:hypothetical protein